MKKILAFIGGFFSALLSALAVIFVMNKTAQPTTSIKGKVKAKNGGVAQLAISNKEKREQRKSKRKLKKLLK